MKLTMTMVPNNEVKTLVQNETAKNVYLVNDVQSQDRTIVIAHSQQEAQLLAIDNSDAKKWLSKQTDYSPQEYAEDNMGLTQLIAILD